MDGVYFGKVSGFKMSLSLFVMDLELETNLQRLSDSMLTCIP